MKTSFVPPSYISLDEVTFYDDYAIISAEDELFKLYDEKNIARKSCQIHPNVNVKDVEDTLDLFSKVDDNPSMLPTIAEKIFASMLPSRLDIIAPPDNGLER